MTEASKLYAVDGRSIALTDNMLQILTDIYNEKLGHNETIKTLPNILETALKELQEAELFLVIGNEIQATVSGWIAIKEWETGGFGIRKR